MLNRNFNDFKFQHKRNKNQIIYTSKKTKSDREVLNLIDNFLIEKNSFIFESVEKGKVRGRYTIFGKNPDKIWEFNKISNEASAQNRNSILKSYDFLLNKKYKVVVNEKTLERVKNYFR